MPQNQSELEGLKMSHEEVEKMLKGRAYEGMPSGDYASDTKQSPTEKPDSNISELKSKPQLSFGEQLVGITFNPSNDGDVAFIKTKMAEVANLLNDRFKAQETSRLSSLIFEGAIAEILNAQMNAVKFVTLKY